jgi:hypothetical protein
VAIRLAGQKAIRLFDVLTHDLTEWPAVVRRFVRGATAKRVLRLIGQADTDMRLAEALVWASTFDGLDSQARCGLEGLAGRVFFST